MPKATLKHLQAIAKAQGYIVEDDRENAALHVHAPDGQGWEGGSLTSLREDYGSHGSYLSAWRAEAIASMIERIADYPPYDLTDADD